MFDAYRSTSEASGDRGDHCRVAGGEQFEGALSRPCAEPFVIQHPLDLPGYGSAAVHDLHAITHHLCHQVSEKGIVSAAEYHPVHLRIADRPEDPPDLGERPFTGRITGFDELYESWTGDLDDLHIRTVVVHQPVKTRRTQCRRGREYRDLP